MTSRQYTLDPDDWGELRALGHRMLDDMLDYLQTLRDRPVWRPMPDEVSRVFDAPMPHEGTPAEHVYASFARRLALRDGQRSSPFLGVGDG